MPVAWLAADQRVSAGFVVGQRKVTVTSKVGSPLYETEAALRLRTALVRRAGVPPDESKAEIASFGRQLQYQSVQDTTHSAEGGKGMQKFTRSLFAVGAVLGLAACGDGAKVALVYDDVGETTEPALEAVADASASRVAIGAVASARG